MLSRIAEALFWIGRYVERADGTAWLLDVHLQLLLEDPRVDEHTMCSTLLAVMGAPPVEEGPARRADVVRQLVLDGEHTASVAHSISAARENARRAREIISAELWEALNETHNRMPRWVSADRTHSFFRWVRARSALAFGLVDSAMSRDEAWLFFSLGRSLERADMSARLLTTSSVTIAGTSTWSALLRSCGAYEAHLRNYRSVPTAASAVQFLLVDRTFPGSVLASFLMAEECLAGIDPSGGVGIPSRPRRRLGRIRSELEFRYIDDTMQNLPQSMRDVQVGVAAVSDAVREQYFPSIAMPIWIEEAL